MEQLRELSKEEQDIKFEEIKSKLIGWSEDLIEEAYIGAKYGLDISHLDIDKWHDSRKMRYYIYCKSIGIDLDNIDPNNWTIEQIKYQSNVSWAYDKIIDLSNLNTAQWTLEYMKEQAFALANGTDLSSLNPTKYTTKQLHTIVSAKFRDIDDIINLNPKLWTADHMTEYWKAKVKGVDLSKLDPKLWTAEQMKFYWKALAKKDNKFAAELDVTDLNGRRAVQLIKAHNANADLSKINDIEKCDILQKYRSKTILDVYIESMSMYNLDISKLINTRDSYDAYDLSYISTFCNMINISIDDYIKNEQYYIEIIDKYDIIGLLRCFKDFLTEHDILLYNKEQINSIILAYEDYGIDITDLDPKTWKYDQMHQHAKSLAETGRGLDHLNRKIWDSYAMYKYNYYMQRYKLDLLDIPNIEDAIVKAADDPQEYIKVINQYLRDVRLGN